MSVPQAGKKTNHKVVSVTYDTKQMRYMVLGNIVLTIVLLLTVMCMNCTIKKQQQTITEFVKTFNELNYKNSFDKIEKNIDSQNQSSSTPNHNLLIEHIETNFDLTRQQLKKIKSELNQIQSQLNSIQNKSQKVTQILKEQSKSSWEMKEIVNSIKKRLQYFTSLIENIQIPKPDFSSMKDSIKGHFTNIKAKIGDIFQKSEENQRNQFGNQQYTNQREVDGKSFMGSLKDKIKRKWKDFKQEQKQL